MDGDGYRGKDTRPHTVSSVNAMWYEDEENDEKQCINVARKELEHMEKEGSRTSDVSRLDLEEEDNVHVYHVNVIINEDMSYEHDLRGGQNSGCKSLSEENESDSVDGRWE